MREQTTNRAIESLNWEKSFEGKNVLDQVYLFNKIILKMFHNFISNKNIICNDKDLPWFNDKIRQIMKKENELLKQFINNRKLQSDDDRLRCIRNDMIKTIRSSKERFHLCLSAKLADRSTSAKTYWSIFKPLLIVKNPINCPVNEKFVTRFLEKAYSFNDFLATNASQYQTTTFYC